MNKIKSLIKEYIDTEYILYEKFVHIFSIGAVAHLIFYLTLKYIYGYKEIFLLRLSVIIIYLIMFFWTWKDFKSPIKKFFYEIVMALSLPAFYTYMILYNNNTPFWFNSIAFGGVLYGITTKIYVMPFGYIAAAFVGTYFFKVFNHGDINLIYSSLIVHKIGFLNAVIGCLLKTMMERSFLHIKDLEVENARNREIKKNYDKLKVTSNLLKKSQSDYKSFAKIGLALSIEKNMKNLLEMIVDAAIKLSGCDVGQLYIMDSGKQNLLLKIDKNVTLGEYMINPVEDSNRVIIPLYKGDSPNNSNILVNACLNVEKIHVSDIYNNDIYNFDIIKRLDMALGYKTKSILVIPMTNYKSEVIGILQLINPRSHENQSLMDFPEEVIELMSSLASQAAVAMTNSELVDNLQELFYDFIKSTAHVIDENSPYNYKHISRVVDLTMLIAEKINEKTEGHFKNIFFTSNELEELKLAAWMHDIGKIIIQDYILGKETRLQIIFDRVELIKTRFELIAKIKENEFMEKKLAAEDKHNLEDEDKEELSKQIKALENDFNIISACNTNKTYLRDKDIAEIRRIAEQKYVVNKEERTYLTEDEVKNLSIRRGTLTAEERKIVESHVSMTLKMSEQLPFPERFAKVPEYAASHHEMLDGSGYPRGLTGKDLPLQSRIMAIADIFEALTAKDRLYREAMDLSKAIEILKDLSDNNKIDKEILELFIEEKIYKEISPQQVDM